jgi:prophage maintenance system killer protein
MNEIMIYQSGEHAIEVIVTIKDDTVWLNRQQLSELFNRDSKTIGKHITNVFKEEELVRTSTVAKFATVQKEGKRLVHREIEYYNLDVIISVGYRVKSDQGVKFRQWATARLKDFLVQGYSINKQRLKQKELDFEIVKTGLRILGRTIEESYYEENHGFLKQFALGLQLLDDFDEQLLDAQGKTIVEILYPTLEEYLTLISSMHDSFPTSIFAKQKDNSFLSSINQIKQTVHGEDMYPTLEEKATNLLYLITKNHSFIDGNKRIAAACFLLFLQKNNALRIEGNKTIISNDTLALLTIYIANSKPKEHIAVKQLILSVLNRNK